MNSYVNIKDISKSDYGNIYQTNVGLVLLFLFSFAIISFQGKASIRRIVIQSNNFKISSITKAIARYFCTGGRKQILDRGVLNK